MMTSDKYCPKCKQTLPRRDMFYTRIINGKTYTTSYCKPCRNALSRAYQRDHPERTRATRAKYRRSGRYHSEEFLLKRRVFENRYYHAMTPAQKAHKYKVARARLLRLASK